MAQQESTRGQGAASFLDEGESIAINVTKSNFLKESLDFMEHLPKASWISLDEEMTGIMLPGGTAKRPLKDEAPAARYSSLKLVPERYSIIQLGICLFEQTDAQRDADCVRGTAFNVRRYKFTLFPPADSAITREVVLNPSSIHFLSQNNMNLDSWTKEGIPFCSGDTATRLLEKFHDDQLKALENNKKQTPIRRKKLELTKTEDKDFHARAMASLREWLDSAIVPGEDDAEGASFLLPPCNSFLRRALYESIPNEYPNLVLETYQDTRIRVWRLNAQERQRRNRRLLREGWEKLIVEKIGIWRVFLALSRACRGEDPLTLAEHVILSTNAEDAVAPMKQQQSTDSVVKRKIPIVVHNGLHDLLFLLTHFHSPVLPHTWEECKELIHSYFPVVYDTKTMASEYCGWENPWSRTALGTLYEQTILSYPEWDRVFTLDGREQLREQAHDAAFDAYMTGAVFYGLTRKIYNQENFPSGVSINKTALWNFDEGCEISRCFYGRNKLHFHLSPYTIDLESPLSDPLGRGMSVRSTFRIAGISPLLTTRDIVRVLTGLVDSRGQRVNFEVIWVNDTAFLVGVVLAEVDCRDESRFEEHGSILWKALHNRFREESIHPLEPLEEKASQPGLWNLWGWLGSLKRPFATSDEKPRKRRRIN